MPVLPASDSGRKAALSLPYTHGQGASTTCTAPPNAFSGKVILVDVLAHSHTHLPGLLVPAVTLVAANHSAAGDLLPVFRLPAGVIVDPEIAVVPFFLGRALSRSCR